MEKAVFSERKKRNGDFENWKLMKPTLCLLFQLIIFDFEYRQRSETIFRFTLFILSCHLTYKKKLLIKDHSTTLS